MPTVECGALPAVPPNGDLYLSWYSVCVVNADVKPLVQFAVQRLRYASFDWIEKWGL